MMVYTSAGELLAEESYHDMHARYGSPWYLAHRIDLHNELKTLAFGEQYPGRTAELNLASKVVHIDADNGVIRLEDGQEHKADLIVGADGIHSITRALVFGGSKAHHTGTSCYRFVMNAEDIQGDPACSPARSDGRCRIFLSDTKRVVIYPCRNGDILNFVCMYKDASEDIIDGWNSASSTEELLRTFSDFGPIVTNCLKKATNVKRWRLLQQDPVDRWIQGRCCLIGDAAHPMLPHQGQGGGQAIEDGVSLGPLLPLGTTPSQVPAALELYQQVRYDRASKIEWLSRTQQAGNTRLTSRQIHDFIYGHDVGEYAKHSRSSKLLL
ncbi:hypothetical protein BJY01DRAFT_256601 [Aspergillus pseudoustus]|uniref:FAD-binding domain-containing protein n=1 Tax=Aspergillus pseudoustus TaxID=1810923 RepID=A0ABR4I704_9EURO